MGKDEHADGCGCGHDHAHGAHDCGCGHDHDHAGEKNHQGRRELIELIPRVGMRYLMAMPHVCTLGVADALLAAGLADAALGWPWHVVDAASGEVLAQIKTHAGYADGAVRVACVVDLSDSCKTVGTGQLRDGLLARLETWEGAVEAGHAAAGPVAPILSEMFDRTPLLGHAVEVVRPDGSVAAHGAFSGLDVWGRAIVMVDGKELTVAPELARIRGI